MALWQYISQHFNPSVEAVALEHSFYVGDAAGRPGDHDDSDRGFAEALNLHFFTERDFFVSSAASHPLDKLQGAA
jgi:bifunctional polynucleotide phosphatase/kinase